jgi:signal transduction histidine kinase
VKKLSFQASRKGITLETDLEPLFPIAVDLALVGKILANLVDNAIKYSPEGTTVTILSKESVKRPGFIEIAVQDEGYGVREEDLKNLFHKFYRPQNDQTMQTKGYGLGLYLSRFFAEMHGGGLEATSERGNGSTFTLYLPIDAQPELESSTLNAASKTGFMTATQIPFDKGESHV